MTQRYPKVPKQSRMLITDEIAEIETSTGPMRVRVLRPKDETRTWPGLVMWR